MIVRFVPRSGLPRCLVSSTCPPATPLPPRAVLSLGTGSFFRAQRTMWNGPYTNKLFSSSYKNNIAQRVTMQSFYMTYGGTNWGHSAAPVVYSSYDYS